MLGFIFAFLLIAGLFVVAVIGREKLQDEHKPKDWEKPRMGIRREASEEQPEESSIPNNQAYRESVDIEPQDVVNSTEDDIFYTVIKDREKIDAHVKFLLQKGIFPKNDFSISSDLYLPSDLRNVSSGSFASKQLKSFMSKILLHFGLSVLLAENAVFNVVNEHDGVSIAGATNGERIIVNFAEGDDSYHIAAIIAHECAHCYLLRKHIKLDNEADNELLTEIATLFLGFSSIYEKAYGYKVTRRASYMRVKKLGYINSDQVDYITAVIRHIKEAQNSNNFLVETIKSISRLQDSNGRTSKSIFDFIRAYVALSVAASHLDSFTCAYISKLYKYYKNVPSFAATEREYMQYCLQAISHFDMIAPRYDFSTERKSRYSDFFDEPKKEYRERALTLLKTDTDKLFSEEWNLLNYEFYNEFYDFY